MSSTDPGTTTFDPNAVNLTLVDARDIICFLQSSGKSDAQTQLGSRVSAIFTILITATLTTFFPVVAKRVPRLGIPFYVYLFARYFGAGVIVATAFIHLLDPAYQAIGPQTCVGMSGGWAEYSWCPGIVLTAVMVMFLINLGTDRWVEKKYGISSNEDVSRGQSSLQVYGSSVAETNHKKVVEDSNLPLSEDDDSITREQSFRQQIAAFLILEFGVIFHSVIIGLNLGVTDGSEFRTLYVVVLFHQSFEGLGIGARMSAIPFKPRSWLPWILCAAYGLTTPIAIAVGLGVRTTYDPASSRANVVSGVLDSMSAGILLYTGLVELMARDFLFNPLRTRDDTRLGFMVGCVILGAGLMALLGKWT
jgi:solute carrier family 39 (zinc transporter), member 1/2/3